jgi:hypothetical protein
VPRMPNPARTKDRRHAGEQAEVRHLTRSGSGSGGERSRPNEGNAALDRTLCSQGLGVGKTAR